MIEIYNVGCIGELTSPLSSDDSWTPLFSATAVEIAVRRYNPIVNRFSHQTTYVGKEKDLGLKAGNRNEHVKGNEKLHASIRIK